MSNFGDWLRVAMVDAGYPPDGSRAGGRTRLAEDSGVALSVITRSLNNGRAPEPPTLRRLARALDRPFTELLVAAGWITTDELAGVDRITDPTTMDPIQRIATLPGLSEAERELITTVVQTYRRTHPDESGDQRTSGGSA